MNAAPLELDQGKPYGGTYSGPAVRDGVFHPEDLIPALFTITYTLSNEAGCTSKLRKDIEILPIPEAKTLPMGDSSFCVYDEPVALFSGKPKGGYFTGNGVVDSSFFPSEAGPGLHQVSYVVEKWGCTDSLSVQFEVLSTPTFEFVDFDPLCVGSDTIVLKAFPEGGHFEGLGVEGNTFISTGLGAGVYDVRYWVEDVSCPDEGSFSLELVSLDESPTIQSNGDSLWVETPYTHLQWWLDNEPMDGEVRPYIRPTADGNYRVNIKGEEGCEAFSEPFSWKLTSAIVEQRLLDQWSVFPNPAKEYAVFNWKNGFERNSEIRIYTSSGKLMRRQVLPDDSDIFVLEVANWEAGIYVAKISIGDLKTQRKLVVEHN